VSLQQGVNAATEVGIVAAGFLNKRWPFARFVLLYRIQEDPLGV
jgi:hypothetical protein